LHDANDLNPENFTVRENSPGSSPKKEAVTGKRRETAGLRSANKNGLFG
jgi:hypothetical protein